MLDDAESNDRVAFEEAYYNLSVRMRDLLRVSSTPPHVETWPLRSRPSTSKLLGSLYNIRLPKLDLPKFSGKYDEWFLFYDSFSAIIHANASLSNIHKLQYLRAAIIVISSLEILDANYAIAWNLLKERYDNKRVIVQTHLKSIVDLPVMTKENASELRQIADGTARHVHALRALKRPTKAWDDILVYILSSKLDINTAREWQSSLEGV